MPKVFITLLFLSFIFSSCNYGDNTRLSSTPHYDSIITKAERLSDSGYKQEALSLVISSFASARSLTIMDRMDYFTYISELYKKDFKDYDKYLSCADSMLYVLDKHGDTKRLVERYVQAYNMKGDALFSKGLYNEAYDNYYRAKTFAQKYADSCALGYFTYSLGMVLYRQQRFDEAAWHFIESYNESYACKDFFVYVYHRQELLDNIGLSYNGAKKYDSALIYYKKALAFIDSNYLRFNRGENVYITAKAVVYGNMGNVYLALNEYDTARQLLQKSIAINLQKGYTNSDAILDQVKLANLYYTTGQISELKDLLVNIKAELDTIPDNNVERSWNKLMWYYYDHEHDSIKAYRYARVYIAMNDSFLSRNKSLMATDLDGRIKNLERQNSIELLNKQNEQDDLYLIIAILIVIITLTTVAFVLRNARRSRKNVGTLTVLNNKVNEQNEKLEVALEELELKDKDKSRILRSVAHDVMNPIAAIMSLADIILSESENYSDEHKEILELIKEACGNSLSLSKDILQAAAKIDPATVEKEWVNLNKLVLGSVKLLSIQAKAKKQRITIIAANDNIDAFVNKKKIWRVINNLLGNAIKFSYENSVIEIHLSKSADKVLIAVKDHGIGIPEKNKSHVFEMFTEAKLHGTSGEVPHGLGLSISLQIARAHNGDIWFESEEGKGTSFYVTLPVNNGV